MSNPIKALLSTPLQMQFISNINALCKLPLALYRFFIDGALSLKNSPINTSDQQLFANILIRQKIPSSIGKGSINAVKKLQSINQKILRLMRTSQPGQVQSNLQNCQKYIGSVLTQNTLIDQIKITYLIQKIASVVHKSLQSTSKTIQTKFGMIQWAVYNLKKTNLNTGEQNNEQQNKEGSNNSTNLKTINKMYVKVSFDKNFSQSQIQKLISSGFQYNNDLVIQAKKQESISNKGKQNKTSKTITMSLIDFRLFMEQIQKVKNLNY